MSTSQSHGTSTPSSQNPLLAPWTGPFGGVPAFDRVEVKDFLPGLDEVLPGALAEIEAIARNPEPPTFENTLVALERAGRALDRFRNYFSVWSGNRNSPEFAKVEQAASPRFSEFGSAVIGNRALFERIQAVHANQAGLNEEQRRLVHEYHSDFVHSGAELDGAAKVRLAEINQRMASLYTTFGQNILADEEDYVLFLAEADMVGLPDWLKAGCKQTAVAKGQPGAYAISNTRSSMDPFLTYSPRRDLRKKVWTTYYQRGGNGDARDNHAIIREILALRHERARLMGFANHAEWMLENTMAKTPQRALELLMSVWPAAVARAHEEVAEMQTIADRENAGHAIEAWDYRFYAEKVRAAKYDLDMNAVKPYLQLEKLREAMMWAAGRLFGLEFREIRQVPVFHPDVRVWEVLDGQGRHVAVWYFDPFARDGKHSGAWMSAYRPQHRVDGTPVTTLVSNNSNFVKAAPGEAVLISWDDATTLFHEFGHALHGICSSVTYPRLSGTSVSRDYVEFPSQLNEHWLTTPEVMERFLIHYQIGEPIPEALVDKIESASTFRQGFDTVEYLASAIVDMQMHTADPKTVDPKTFEDQCLGAIGMPREIVMRHRTPQFAHVFSGDGYSAGYYSYLWADTLTADAAEAFEEAGSYYDPVVAKRLFDEVLSKGNTIDPSEGFRRFRGRDVDTAALMRKRGFQGGRPSPC